MEGATHTIDERQRVLRRCVVAPGYMPVRPNQYEAPFIERGYRGIVNRNHFEWHVAQTRRYRNRLRIGRRVAKGEQYKAAAEEIERRTFLFEPRMWRARARPCDRRVMAH